MGRWLAAISVCLGLLLPAAADANQKDPRLNPLFEQLRSLSDPSEAKVVEMTIWAIWSEANDPATDSLMTIGRQAMQAGNLAGAVALFDAVVTRRPDFAEGWNSRATALFMMGQLQASAADVEKTLALEPRHFGALAGLGQINLALDREEEALKAFDAALKVNPHLQSVRAAAETLRKRKKDKDI
jgi:tetratricopeptide (TPR) repeat protein